VFDPCSPRAQLTASETGLVSSSCIVDSIASYCTSELVNLSWNRIDRRTAVLETLRL